MAGIVLKDIRKIYAGGVEAVKGVSLDIRAGEFIVLVGPSGCGKSTLLRMIAGLEDISSGEVRIGERLVNEVEPADRDIAMVFQNYALYPHMSVYNNMAYGLRNRKTPKAEIEQRVAEAARMLEIEPFLDRKPKALSGGQRQRVAMGRAIVRKPSVFLFDEPLSNLDAKLRVTMRGEIKRLQRRLGTTSLYVTHDQLEAMTLATRLVVLNKGSIEQIGTPLEVYHAPASAFVAAFIGSPAMNLLSGHVDGNRLHLGEMMLKLPGALPPAGPVTVGMRAEDIELAGDEADAMDFHLDHVEELGAQRLVHGMVGELRLTVAFAPHVPISERMYLAINPDKLHFFCADTGQRLPVNSMKTQAEVSTRAVPV
ncbi:sn-glycerol-3-phosphate ABC transporter ATP-binding protein UgpC [Falsochrobactrum shanghaiense]|uniref:sn-glycerol-3-phosphate ABC transporter ATP-binding protein UgpC n=1 Tax=Falsochrobactrum shanghaiense TaxID=2201899 RepID=A0A316J5Z7_9HYPH|nr:sn-glycerol-3-phosphate import ATP-binding protein UgpC [Falsochrobactrum shanghaiense]PWL17287.1 sn-glycerol-3-phosphate ABC transporter ATP-binding protein UgpC [Falsochrobactrum shanghaiense]